MLNKNIKEKISLKINDYKIYIYIHEDNLYIEILSSKNKDFFYYDEFSFKILSNNEILKKYKNIQEIYYFLKQVIQNSKDNHLIIEEYKNIFKFIIKLKNENITFQINKEDDEEEDDSIFKNNLNNFENILNEIENDMNNLDPYIKELKDKNKKITDENIKLKKEIEALNQENEKLKQELNNKINSKDNLISSKNENEIKVKTITQK